MHASFSTQSQQLHLTNRRAVNELMSDYVIMITESWQA